MECKSLQETVADVKPIWLPAALHTDIDLLERDIEHALFMCRSSGVADLFVLYGGACSPSLDALLKKYGALRPEAGNCLDILLGPLKAEAEAEKAFVLTPGWIRAWPSIMKALGWDVVDVRMNLGRYAKIIVYDAGVRPLSDEEIIGFFDLTELYVDVRPLSLEHFSEAIKKLFNGKNHRQKRREIPSLAL